MKVKFENKINIIPITLYFIWCLYVLYFFLFRIKSFASETPCGAGYLMIGLPVFTIIFTFFTLIIILILNKMHKKKYHLDYEYVIIPFLVLTFLGVINIIFK
jgi:hypothetical protein